MQYVDCWERVGERRESFNGLKEETRDMHTDSRKESFSLPINFLSRIHSM